MPGGWAGSTRSSRLPPGWAALRAKVMADHAGVCHLCGQPGADRVDHIVAGDDHSEANLAPVHDAVPPHCHRAKSSAEGNAARWRVTEKRPKAKHPGLTD